MFVDFDPQRHKGRKLFELQSVVIHGVFVAVPIPTDIPFERAKEIPWYFVVEESAEKLTLKADERESP